MRKRTIRASEIGTYLYCKRAWWYQQQGVESSNQESMAAGTSYHRTHGKLVVKGVLYRLGAWLMLVSGVVVLAIWLVQQWMG